MHGLNKQSHFLKEAQIMYERIPEELRRELSGLPSDNILLVLQAISSFTMLY